MQLSWVCSFQQSNQPVGNFQMRVCMACSRIRKEASVAEVGWTGGLGGRGRGSKQIGGVGSLAETVVLSKYFKHLNVFLVLQNR